MVMVSINHHHIILSKFETAFGANFGETFSREREEQLKFENAAYFEKAHRFAEYKTQTNKNSKKRETNNVTRFVRNFATLAKFYKSLGNFLNGLFSICQTVVPTQVFLCYWANRHCCKWPKIE